MRCFIAVDIDDRVRDRIGELGDQLRGDLGDEGEGIKWVDPGRMHLTLKFLGEVKDSELMEVCRIVESVAVEYNGFSIEVCKVGVFGRPAKVVWVGVDENSVFEDMQSCLEERFGEAGWKVDNKKFVAHLTMCRVRSFELGKRLERLIGGYADFKAGSCDINSICVYESDLTKTGPVYRLMKEYTLEGDKFPRAEL
jgi:2'-5' RNA ligase